MASLIDIRRRIRSVKNTQQITKAMKMVAASKLRRAQDRAVASRPYAKTLDEILVSVASRVPPREDGAPPHPLLATREEKNVVLVVVSGDKGLAGGFNTNVNRAAGAFLREAREKGIENVSLLVARQEGERLLEAPLGPDPRRAPRSLREVRRRDGCRARARARRAVRRGRDRRGLRRVQRVQERHLPGRLDEEAAPLVPRQGGAGGRQPTTSTSRRPTSS